MKQLREKYRDQLADTLHESELVIAMWEGGSVAFDRDDDMSDLDLQAIVEDGCASEVLTIFEQELTTIAPIELCWPVPSPNWTGTSQRFYRLRGLAEHLMFDFLIIERSAEQRFNEPERHGRSNILFDKDGRLTPEPLDTQAHLAKMRAELNDIKLRVPMLSNLVEKAIRRNQPIDAISFYTRLVLTQLLSAIGIRYRPLQYDFGGRYLHEVLPNDLAAEIVDLHYISDIDDLAKKLPRALAIFNEIVAAIDLDSLQLDQLAADARERWS